MFAVHDNWQNARESWHSCRGTLRSSLGLEDMVVGILYQDSRTKSLICMRERERRNVFWKHPKLRNLARSGAEGPTEVLFDVALEQYPCNSWNIITRLIRWLIDRWNQLYRDQHGHFVSYSCKSEVLVLWFILRWIACGFLFAECYIVGTVSVFEVSWFRRTKK